MRSRRASVGSTRPLNCGVRRNGERYVRRAVLHILMTAVSIAAGRPCIAEDAIRVSFCELASDPATYNHKLIEVAGRVSRGFEDFTLSDEACPSRSEVWLEIGGTKGAEVMYCCNVPVDPERQSPLIVEGIETSVVRDKQLDRFDEITKKRGLAKATIVGRFFSGEEKTLPRGKRWMGYGHMGFFSLLVIQQVLTVSR
jgi:hypothetical protein